MRDEIPTAWSFPVANGHFAPRSIAMAIEAASGHHLSERQIAQWAVDNGEVTALPTSEHEVHYGLSPAQALATLRELGRQYGIEAELRFGSVGDLESELHEGYALTIEIADAEPGATPRAAVLRELDRDANAIEIADPGASSATGRVPLSALERAWAATNGAMIVTAGDAGPGPVLLPVVIDSHLVAPL